MPLPELTTDQWGLAALAAFGVGVSKGGLAGVGLFHVLIFATLFDARESTGIVLPMLVIGDSLAVILFRQHARWDYVRRMLPPAVVGVILGTVLMHLLADVEFRPVIGGIVLLLTVLQLMRITRPNLFSHVPHSLWFAWSLGLLAGMTTMLANGAGPIMALYFLSVSLPKLELVGTSAWFFLVVNTIKIPFSAGLGLINARSLALNFVLAPMIPLGLLAGRWLVVRIPQKAFDATLLVFAGFVAMRFLGVF
ncbi:MAG: sulfite exporter TauE/SafE family protein [Planctomycetaceae bacterium]|nr:sulfite exporter TauE/SafE family protein [Planctomycetaceae bacterium]